MADYNNDKYLWEHGILKEHEGHGCEWDNGGLKVCPDDVQTTESDTTATVKFSNRHPNSARFHEILTELGQLHDRKQSDYGAGDDPFANLTAATEFGMPASLGVMLRMNDKMARIKSFAQSGSLANESVEDSLRDIAVYGVIALVLLEQEAADD